MAIVYTGRCYTRYRRPYLGYSNKALEYNSILLGLIAAYLLKRLG